MKLLKIIYSAVAIGLAASIISQIVQSSSAFEMEGFLNLVVAGMRALDLIIVTVIYFAIYYYIKSKQEKDRGAKATSSNDTKSRILIYTFLGILVLFVFMFVMSTP
ncbi:MAG TPA: hypothetical protein PLF30_03510 [Candidatus Moranbacteria bacterium]|jgi:heme/copper-type cytochrome/quinol oxidase subunit 2|nr:hypothetical protein [Candidatus Moranbacteria bacterium]HPX94593.1 hypothetical protein [Candidatus Moranbacteria bacterium]HQB59890.1 hypothetical protein [Candidatus Moranbacteria bacterium]